MLSWSWTLDDKSLILGPVGPSGTLDSNSNHVMAGPETTVEYQPMIRWRSVMIIDGEYVVVNNMGTSIRER